MSKFYEQGPVLGAFLSEIAAPNLLRVYKAAGLDFVIVDCEHGYFDDSQVAALAAVANGIGLPILVRIPHVSRDRIQKPLDAGVDGILIPMVGDAQTAQAAAALAKYPPQGQRGISTFRPHSQYAKIVLADYLREADRRTMVFAQIETRQGLARADAIAAVDGLDGLFVGPNDLAADMGAPGMLNSEAMQAAYRAVTSAAAAHGKPAGIITSDETLIRDCRQAGMRLFSCNSETGLLSKQVARTVGNFQAFPRDPA